MCANEEKVCFACLPSISPSYSVCCCKRDDECEGKVNGLMDSECSKVCSSCSGSFYDICGDDSKCFCCLKSVTNTTTTTDLTADDIVDTLVTPVTKRASVTSALDFLSVDPKDLNTTPSFRWSFPDGKREGLLDVIKNLIDSADPITCRDEPVSNVLWTYDTKSSKVVKGVLYQFRILGKEEWFALLFERSDNLNWSNWKDFWILLTLDDFYSTSGFTVSVKGVTSDPSTTTTSTDTSEQFLLRQCQFQRGEAFPLPDGDAKLIVTDKKFTKIYGDRYRTRWDLQGVLVEDAKDGTFTLQSLTYTEETNSNYKMYFQVCKMSEQCVEYAREKGLISSREGDGSSVTAEMEAVTNRDAVITFGSRLDTDCKQLGFIELSHSSLERQSRCREFLTDSNFRRAQLLYRYRSLSYHHHHYHISYHITSYHHHHHHVTHHRITVISYLHHHLH